MKFRRTSKPWEARALKSEGRKWVPCLQNRENSCLPELIYDQTMPDPHRGGVDLLYEDSLFGKHLHTHTRYDILSLIWVSSNLVKMTTHEIGPHFSGRETWRWWCDISKIMQGLPAQAIPTLLSQVHNGFPKQKLPSRPLLQIFFCFKHCFRPTPPHLVLSDMIWHLSCEK